MEETSSGSPISIDANEVTLGSDKNLAVLAFDDPSVDGLHARLTRGEDGSFLLADQGSIAGTWINYTLVDRSGTCLQHGDTIHIGRVGFQFKIRDSAFNRKPVIIPERFEA
jgi:predicted component of type VI protein secretion system